MSHIELYLHIVYQINRSLSKVSLLPTCLHIELQMITVLGRSHTRVRTQLKNLNETLRLRNFAKIVTPYERAPIWVGNPN